MKFFESARHYWTHDMDYRARNAVIFLPVLLIVWIFINAGESEPIAEYTPTHDELLAEHEAILAQVTADSAEPMLVGGPQKLASKVGIPDALLGHEFDVDVQLSLVVTRSGRAESVETEGISIIAKTGRKMDDGYARDLQRSVVRAVQSSVWAPARKDGKPIDSEYTMHFKFSIGPEDSSPVAIGDTMSHATPVSDSTLK